MVKWEDAVTSPIPDNLDEHLTMLYRVMGQICKAIDRRIEAASPELASALREFRLSDAGHFRFVHTWDPELRFSLEAVAHDGTAREFYWARGELYMDMPAPDPSMVN